MKLDMSMIEELRKRLPPEAQDTIDEVEAEFLEEEGEEIAEDFEDPMEGVMEEGPEDEELESPPAELPPEEEGFEEEESEEDLEEDEYDVPAFFKKKK